MRNFFYDQIREQDQTEKENLSTKQQVQRAKRLIWT